MPLKNSNAVAVERRMDLASLFCMIGRHGPAVALAVIAMVSVLAGFIIYRNVRGKRRKAAAADGDGKCPGAERDASVSQLSQEECHSSVKSTDVSDESDVKEDVDLVQSDLKIRHRRAAAAATAAEKIPSPSSPPNSDILAPENKHTTSENAEEVAVVGDSNNLAEIFAEEVNQGLLSVAEMVVEDAVDCHQGAIADIVEDVIEDVHVNDTCMKKPEVMNDENHEEEEKVLKAECQKDEDVATDKDVSDKTTRQEEENIQSALNSLVCFEQTPHVGEKGDDDRLQDNKTTLQTNSESSSEKPVIHIEDVPAPCMCYGKDAEFEKENPDCIDYRSYSCNNSLSSEEEKKNDSKRGEEELLDYRVIAQQAESLTCELETDLPSTQQDQCDHVTGMVMPPIQDSDWDKDDEQADEVIQEVVDDHINKLAAVKFDTHSPQFEQEGTEQKEVYGLTCNQEDVVLCDGADQEKEKMQSSDNIVACIEECESSSVALPCLSGTVKVNNHDNSLSGITTDAKAPIPSITDFPDLSIGCHSQIEDKIGPSLDEDTESTILDSQMPPLETENLPENNRNGRTVVLAEECYDKVYGPHVQSCYKDQQCVQLINIEVFDNASVDANPDTLQNVTASAIVEEMSCPHQPSMCQDQQSESVENDEAFSETKVSSITDADACNNASLAADVMSEEKSQPDMLPSSEDQQSDHMESNENISEVTSGTVPVMTKENSHPMCQIYLTSFEQSEQRDDDASSPGVGEESGISSMAVSPDFQDTGNEFDMTVGNMVLPVRDCDLQSEGQTVPQNSLFADDVIISVITEDTAGTVFGPNSSSNSQACCSEPTDRNKYESFAANEDMFGHEIEDGYHRAMDEFSEQIAASVARYTNGLKIQTDIKGIVKVVEIKEKAGENVEKKEDTKAEKEIEEDYEKTEISIMEATMDNNEWITDSNYQVLPWLNLSVSSFAQDHTKTNQLPNDECQSSSAVTDASSIDTTDIPSSAEVNPTCSALLVDENMENNKKIVAVQPMPQNVNVTFRVHYFTQSPYQTVAVTGNQEELGNWKGFIPLEQAKDGHWATVVSLPSESHVEWKFVVVDKGEVCRWEECGNRLLDTGYGDDLLVHKWWGLL